MLCRYVRQWYSDHVKIAGFTQSGLAVVARTPAAGIALVNGTPNLLTWTTPNDGQIHTFMVSGGSNTTVAATGGAIQIQWTTFGVVQITQIDAGGHGVGIFQIFLSPRMADPNTQVVISQQTALTAGAVAAALSLLGI